MDKQETDEKKVLKTRSRDVEWMGTLYGTAIGAGILFLPLQAIKSGILSLILATIFIYPMVYFSHKALARISLLADDEHVGLTGSFIQFLGKSGGMVANIIYFLCTFSIMVGYALALPKTLISLFEVFGWQGSTALDNSASSKALFGLIIMVILVGVMLVGRNFVIKVTTIIIFPLLICLIIICVLLIPHISIMDVSMGAFTWRGFIAGCLTIFPILFFAVNHSPTISEFATSYRDEIKDKKLLLKKVSKVLTHSNILINAFTLVFVYVVILALPDAKALAINEANPNLNVTGIIAMIYQTGLLHYLGPIIAICAIISSFFGTFFGTRESLVALLKQIFKMNHKLADTITIIFLFLILWYLTISNIAILNVLGLLTAPLIAIMVFLLPIIVIYKNKEFQEYRNKGMTTFLLISGFIVILGYFIGNML